MRESGAVGLQTFSQSLLICLGPLVPLAPVFFCPSGRIDVSRSVSGRMSAKPKAHGDKGSNGNDSPDEAHRGSSHYLSLRQIYHRHYQAPS